MKKLVVLLLGLTALAACAPSEWQELRVAEGGFRVLMRGQANYARQQIDTPAGKMSAHLYSSSRPDAYFAVGYSDYPLAQVVGGSPDEVFAGIRATWMRRINGKLVAESPTTLDGKYPGIEFTVESKPDSESKAGAKMKDTFLQARLYLVDQRLYQVIASGRKSELSQGLVNRFLESFRLIPATDAATIQLAPPPEK